MSRHYRRNLSATKRCVNGATRYAGTAIGAGIEIGDAVDELRAAFAL
jgi:hypothetical protein